jgi:hypothetical protein
MKNPGISSAVISLGIDIPRLEVLVQEVAIDHTLEINCTTLQTTTELLMSNDVNLHNWDCYLSLELCSDMESDTISSVTKESAYTDKETILSNEIPQAFMDVVCEILSEEQVFGFCHGRVMEL